MPSPTRRSALRGDEAVKAGDLGGGQEPATATWHAAPLDAVFAALEADRAGLSEAEAEARLARFGANKLPRAEPPGPFLIFLRQFKNPLVYLLVVATLVSLLVGELLDAIFIFVVLLFNAAIGTLQEWQAQKKAAELDSLVPHQAVARRDGEWRALDTAALVPGDVVRLESGALVSADLRLMDGRELLLDESLLTGESLPVAKEVDADLAPEAPLANRINMLFAGTTVVSGRATAMTVATGRDTQIGRIAEALTHGDAQQPPLIRQLERFSRLIGIATVVLIGLVAVAQALQGTPLVTVFLVAIALAVAAIPEGLPVAITVALAIATNRMQRRNVIVRSLPAVEGLGSCTLIASDKTGTLTCNELTVQRVVLSRDIGFDRTLSVSGEGYDPRGDVLVDGAPPDAALRDDLLALATTSVLCNEASIRSGDDGMETLGDTVDIAFLVFAAKLGLEATSLRQRVDWAGSIPYEPERRYAAAFVRERGVAQPRTIVHVKGAAEVVVSMCRNVDEAAVLAEVESLAANGYRVLAVAAGPCETGATPNEDSLRGLSLLGLVGLIDPIRPEVPAAVDRCRQAGVAVRMITGDHPTTALAIARQLGLAESPAEVAGEAEVRMISKHPEAFAHFVESKRIFARVEPVQKLAIVQAMQRAGHVVAVTGDGVNDAPALNAADIGVAMGRSGTDVARAAADLVIADDNFASIVSGIEEGRVAYDNVRKLIYLLISTGLGEIVLFLLAILFALPVPLFALQLLWLNLVTNGVQHVALAFEPGEPGVGQRPPRPPREPLFDRRMIAQVTVAGCYMGAMCVAAYGWFLSQGLAVEEARNLILLLMVLFENAHALNARSERQSIFRIPLSANWFLVAAVIGAHALHIGAIFTPGLSEALRVMPMGLLDWVVVAALAFSLVLVMETFKRLYPANADAADQISPGR